MFIKTVHYKVINIIGRLQSRIYTKTMGHGRRKHHNQNMGRKFPRKPNPFSVEELKKELTEIDNLTENINALNSTLENPVVIDDLDVSIEDEIINTANIDNTDKTPEEVRNILLEAIDGMDVEEKAKFIENLSKLDKMNPENKNFTGMSSKGRDDLSKKLQVKLKNLEMHRKSKQAELAIRSKYENAMAEKFEAMMNQTGMRNNHEHVHGPNCQHNHDHNHDQYQYNAHDAINVLGENDDVYEQVEIKSQEKSQDKPLYAPEA